MISRHLLRYSLSNLLHFNVDSTDFNNLMTANNSIPDVSIFRPVLIVSGLIIIMAAMRAASSIVATLFFIFFIALFFLPLKSWLIRKGVPSWLAVLIIITILILLITGVLLSLIHI